MPVVSYSHRNQFQTNCIGRSPVSGLVWRRPGYASAAARCANECALFDVLLVHLLRELRRLDAVLLLELLDEPGLVPVDDRLRHEIGEVLLALLHGQSPRLHEDRLERHVVVLPFGLLQFADDCRVVVRERDAVAVAQCGVRFGGAGERDAFDAVLLLQLLVVERALDQAHLLAAQLVPASQVLGLLRHHVRARGIVIGLNDVDDLGPLGRVAHRRDQKVDLALLQELDTVRRNDRDELETYAKSLRDVGGEIRLETDDLARRIEIAERTIVRLRADYEDALLLDVLQLVRPGVAEARHAEQKYGCRDGEPSFTHFSPPFSCSWTMDAVGRPADIVPQGRTVWRHREKGARGKGARFDLSRGKGARLDFRDKSSLAPFSNCWHRLPTAARGCPSSRSAPGRRLSSRGRCPRARPSAAAQCATPSLARGGAGCSCSSRARGSARSSTHRARDTARASRGP